MLGRLYRRLKAQPSDKELLPSTANPSVKQLCCRRLTIAAPIFSIALLVSIANDARIAPSLMRRCLPAMRGQWRHRLWACHLKSSRRLQRCGKVQAWRAKR